MSLENILQALETEAEGRLAEIEQAAQAELERINTQAQAEAAAMRQKHIAAVQAPLRAEQARILNRAKLEALQLVMGTREALITSALEAAAARLAALPACETYAHRLQQLAQTAVDALAEDGQAGQGGRLQVRVQSGDVGLMQRLVEQMGLSAVVEGGLEHDVSPWGCLGGLVVTTPDGRISLVNTLAARLQRAAGLYRAQIAELALGQPEEG